MEPKSTLVCTKCKVEKSTEDFNKRNASKLGFQFKCKDCEKVYKYDNKERRSEANKKYNNENKKRRAEISKRWFKENKERSVENAKNWREKNKERIAENSKNWNNKNKDRKAETDKKWNLENPDKKNAINSKRRSKKLQACPPWFTEDHKLEIIELFAIAKERTEVTGFTYEIDHIHPLNNKYICGLHLPCNLQILSTKANRSKSNKFKPFIESQINYKNPWEINY